MERRSHPRVAVRMRVEFRHLKRPEETFAETARDVSDGGLFVATTVGLEPGTLVSLDIRPGPGVRPIHIKAEVVRVEEGWGETGSRQEGRTRGMGLRFVASEPGEVERLAALAQGLAAAQEDA